MKTLDNLTPAERETIPFTYLLIFKPTGQFYYGVRYKKYCNPNDLWTTYFSSSITVETLISEHGKDSFEYKIRKLFDNKIDALSWETKFLKKVNASHNPKFLNKCNNNLGTARGNIKYEWRYNPITNEEILCPEDLELQHNFIKKTRNVEKAAKGVKNKISIKNITTLEEKIIPIDSIIPDGWIKGRFRESPTKNTIWIYNIETNETKIFDKSLPIPSGWEKGNKMIKNINRIAIHKKTEGNIINKKIYKTELEHYMSIGYELGVFERKDCPVFKYENNEFESFNIKKSELESYKLNGFYIGIPNLYKIIFTDNTTIILPKQIIVEKYKIHPDMISYSEKHKTGSKKYNYMSIIKIL